MTALLASVVFAGSAYAAVTRYEESSPQITWSGTWTPASLPLHPVGHSAGSLFFTQATGATATFQFSVPAGSHGTVTLIGATWRNRGIAEVSLNGAAPVDVDQWSDGTADTNTVKTQQSLWTSPPLDPGSHTVVVRFGGRIGTHTPAVVTPALITVDAFDVDITTDPPVVSTSASSWWTLGFGVVAAAGVAGVSLRRRSRA